MLVDCLKFKAKYPLCSGQELHNFAQITYLCVLHDFQSTHLLLCSA